MILLKLVGMLPSASNGSRILPIAQIYFWSANLIPLRSFLERWVKQFEFKILEHLWNKRFQIFIESFPHLGTEIDLAIFCVINSNNFVLV